MDGTLLNDKMEISPENTAAIKKAQAAGIEFIVATGRGLSEAQPLLNQAGLDPAYITLNGAQVFDTAGQLVVNEPLTDRMAKQLATELRAQGFYFELVTNRGVYSESKVRRIQNVADLLVNLNEKTRCKDTSDAQGGTSRSLNYATGLEGKTFGVEMRKQNFIYWKVVKIYR